MRLAVQVQVDGSINRLDLDAPQGSYQVLKDGVGGWIEAVDLREDMTMWLNEEGKLDGLPVNVMASRMFNEAFGAGKDIMVGDAVFTGGTDDEGDTLGLTEEQAQELEAHLEEVRLTMAFLQS